MGASHYAVVSRAQRSTEWCAADPGPFQAVAVPDQRCTASRCTASGTRVIDCRIAFPSHQLNQSTLPRSRARIAASGLCLFASLTPTRGGRSAERRSGVCETPVGHAMTRRVRRLARRLASHDAGRSPLGAPPWRFWAARGRASLPAIALGLRFGRHPDRSQRAPRSQVIVPGGRGPCLPRQRLQAAAAGRHASLRLQDVSGRRPQ
jgi:hypothetical protein